MYELRLKIYVCPRVGAVERGLGRANGPLESDGKPQFWKTVGNSQKGACKPPANRKLFARLVPDYRNRTTSRAACGNSQAFRSIMAIYM